MVDLQVATMTGANATLEELTIEEFRSSLRGRLIQPGDADYEQSRKVWNANIDKYRN
jgi:hypothetical protein